MEEELRRRNGSLRRKSGDCAPRRRLAPAVGEAVADGSVQGSGQTVGRWELEFDDPDENCLRRQARSIAFAFQDD